MMKKLLFLILVLCLCLSCFSCEKGTTPPINDAEPSESEGGTPPSENGDTPPSESDGTTPSENGGTEPSEGEETVDYGEYSIASAAAKLAVKYQEAKQEGYAEFLDKLEVFAARLTHEVYADSNKKSNLCISPVSVYMALALTIESTGGETREELLRAVGVTYDEVKSFTKYLYAFANKETIGGFDEKGNMANAVRSQLTNSIWADNDVSLNEAGVDDLAEDYNCDLYNVDFGTDEGEKAIEAYIKDKTHGLIDGDVDLPPETLITMINTFYLRDRWYSFGSEMPFADGTFLFQNADGSETEVKLLRSGYLDGKAYEGEGYTAFYVRTDDGYGYTLKIILPNEGYTLDEVFTAENIRCVTSLADYGHQDDVNELLHYTRIFFPEYEASFDGDLSEMLQNDYDVHAVFDTDTADFSGIADGKMALLGLEHKCALTVDKTGISGTAVSSASFGAAIPPPYEKVYHDFVVDRAFGFVILDGYGTVLFSGAVNTVE